MARCIVLNLSHLARAWQIRRIPIRLSGSAGAERKSLQNTRAPMHTIRIARAAALLALVLAGGGTAQAQNGYLRPPDPIPSIVLAQPVPAVLVGRDRQTLAL